MDDDANGRTRRDEDAAKRDEYDYWVNVCQAVVAPPKACEGKPGALPLGNHHLIRRSAATAGDSRLGRHKTKKKRGKRKGRGRGRGRDRMDLEEVEYDDDNGETDDEDDYDHAQQQRKKPETECHSLGSLDNVTFGLIDPARLLYS